MTDVDRLLVCGSRSIDDSSVVRASMDDAPWNPSTIVHGDADGVDTHASRLAEKREIDVETHPVPEWAWYKVGHRAGSMRNEYMVEQSDGVVAIWDGESDGTKNTIRTAIGDIPVYKVVCGETNDGWIIHSTTTIYDDQSDLTQFV